MASITTNFGTVTAVLPASFAMTLSEAEVALIAAEGATLFSSSNNQAIYAHTYALFQKLLAAQASTAPIGTGGTAPPATTTFTI